MPESRSRLTARKIQIEDVIRGNYYQQDGFDPNYIITPYGLRVSRGRVLGTVVDTFINDDETYGAVTIDDGTETIRAKFFQDLDMMAEIEAGDIVEAIGKIKEYDDEIYIQPELLLQRGPQYELLRALEYQEVRDTWADYVEQARTMEEADKSREDIRQELRGEGLDEPEIDGILKYLTLGDDAFEKATETAASAGDGATLTQSTAQHEATAEAPEDGGAETHPTVDEDESDDEDGADTDHREAIMDAIDDLDDGDGADYADIQDETGLDEEELEDAVNDLLSDGTCYEPRPGRIKRL